MKRLTLIGLQSAIQSACSEFFTVRRIFLYIPQILRIRKYSSFLQGLLDSAVIHDWCIAPFVSLINMDLQITFQQGVVRSTVSM
jgi:hypothetical protein